MGKNCDGLFLWESFEMAYECFVYYVLFLLLFKQTDAACSEEVTFEGVPVLWAEAESETWAESDPLCYDADTNLIKRYCNGTSLEPLNEQCVEIVKRYDVDNYCPPGFSEIANDSSTLCYQIEDAVPWDYPCQQSWGNTLISDLSDDEISTLLTVLKKTEMKYFWLPGQRRKSFNPIVWTLPGKDWGSFVTSGNVLQLKGSIFKNCLALDVDKKTLITDWCTSILPSLCLIDNKPLPMQCPPGYYTFTFKDKTKCFGIEKSNDSQGSSWNRFLSDQCKKPMVIESENDTLIFLTIASKENISVSQWCWNEAAKDVPLKDKCRRAINQKGEFGVMREHVRLNCMVCEKNATLIETQLDFEYNTEDKKLHLTVYFPSGLWKEDVDEKGFQCFSNAKGFTSVIDVNDNPLVYESSNTLVVSDVFNLSSPITDIVKLIYTITPFEDSSGQYWCEAHTTNFTLLETKSILVQKQSSFEHVFSIVISLDNNLNDNYSFPDITEVFTAVSEILEAKQVFLMDILDINLEHVVVLLHAYIGIETNNATLLPVILEELTLKLEREFVEMNIHLINMSSSTHCMPSRTENAIDLDWSITNLGNIVAPKQFCLQDNGLPVTRTCSGSYLLGAKWGKVNGVCSQNYKATNRTTYLYNVAQSLNEDSHVQHFISDGIVNSLVDLDTIIPADVFYLSRSLRILLRYFEKNDSILLTDPYYFQNIVWAMNRIMFIDWRYLRLSQTLNSTNVIVDTVDEILNFFTKLATSTLKLYPNEKNYIVIRQSHYIVQISVPQENSITGLALIKNSNSDQFTDMSLKPLFRNTTVNDVLSFENLELAAWVPEITFTWLRGSTKSAYNSNLPVVMTVFHNDAVFQQIAKVPRAVNSRIIGISIPDHDTNLRYPVIIILKELSNSGLNQSCGFWDFDSLDDSESAPGFWNDDGCYYLGSSGNMTICLCYHLTHFGQLVYWSSNDSSSSTTHFRALNMITVVGCFLSLFGISGIWITALVFHSWRKKPGTKILLQLSFSIAMPLIVMIYMNYKEGLFYTDENDYYKLREENTTKCVLIGASLHYSVLSAFTWMLITAVLQFIRFVKVLGINRPSNFLLKYSAIGWGFPLVPVAILLLIDRKCYIPEPVLTTEDQTQNSLCYPTGNYFYYGVLLPIAAILITNICLFARVMFAIARGPDGKIRTDCLIGAQLRLSIFLFFLLGLSWIFGFISYTNSRLMWSYMFCISATLQGFVLFLFFVICDPNTRDLWLTLMQMKNLIHKDFSTTGTDMNRSNSISSITKN